MFDDLKSGECGRPTPHFKQCATGPPCYKLWRPPATLGAVSSRTQRTQRKQRKERKDRVTANASIKLYVG